jgi:hypothetical protein
MRVNRAYLEAILVASLLLLGGGFIAATSAEQQDELVDLSFLEGDWDFNGIEAFVRPATLASAAIEDNRARPSKPTWTVYCSPHPGTSPLSVLF